MGIVTVLNDLNSGRLVGRTWSGVTDEELQSHATRKVLTAVLREACSFYRARRSFDSGVNAVQRICKRAVPNAYTKVASVGVPQVAIIASAIVEQDERKVDMLSALPGVDADFFTLLLSFRVQKSKKALVVYWKVMSTHSSVGGDAGGKSSLP